MKVVSVNNDFPAGFYEALGSLAVAFGRLEYEIKLAVKTLSGKSFAEGMAQAETTRQFRRLCNKAKKDAAAKLPTAHLSLFLPLIDTALDLATIRNDNIHALWTTDNGKPYRYRPFMSNKTKTLVWRSYPITVKELATLAKAIHSLYGSIHAARKVWPTI